MCKNNNSNLRWNKKTFKIILISIKDHINNLTPAEKILIFQQTGMPSKNTSSYKFIKDFSNGKIPLSEVEKFIKNKKSSIDNQIFDDPIDNIKENTVIDKDFNDSQEIKNKSGF